DRFANCCSDMHFGVRRRASGTPMPRPHRLLLATVLLATTAFTLPAQSGLPTPESVFGFRVGADSQLVDYSQSIDYFRRLDEASDHVRLIEVGRTSFGRPWTVALIS